MTYIQLLQVLESFASEHKEVKRFKSDFLEQLGNFSTEDKTFPILYVSLSNMVLNNIQYTNFTNITLTVYSFDLINDDRTNVNNILNTTSLILNDLHTFLKDGDLDGPRLIQSSNILPINNYILDDVTGNSMTITVEIPTNSVCDIPFYDSPIQFDGCCDQIYDPPYVCAGVRVFNSDLSVDLDIDSGDEYEMVDAPVNVYDQDSNLLGTGSVISITGGDIEVTLPSNIPVGAELFKTFQTQSYVQGDDGDLELGRLVDWFTLNEPNPFGNTDRFTDIDGLQIYGNNIVLDWSTYANGKVLGYYRVILNYGNWITSVPLVQSLSIGIFTSGWRMTNYREFWNILYRNVTPAYNYAPFNFNTIKYFWTSSTHTDGTQAIIDQGNYYVLSPFSKAVSLPSLACRTFNVSGINIT